MGDRDRDREREISDHSLTLNTMPQFGRFGETLSQHDPKGLVFKLWKLNPKRNKLQKVSLQTVEAKP